MQIYIGAEGTTLATEKKLGVLEEEEEGGNIRTTSIHYNVVRGIFWLVGLGYNLFSNRMKHHSCFVNLQLAETGREWAR